MSDSVDQAFAAAVRGPKHKGMERSRKGVKMDVATARQSWEDNPNRTDWEAAELCKNMGVQPIKQAFIILLNGQRRNNPEMTIEQARQYMSQVVDPVALVEQTMVF